MLGGCFAVEVNKAKQSCADVEFHYRGRANRCSHNPVLLYICPVNIVRKPAVFPQEIVLYINNYKQNVKYYIKTTYCILY